MDVVGESWGSRVWWRGDGEWGLVLRGLTFFVLRFCVLCVPASRSLCHHWYHGSPSTTPKVLMAALLSFQRSTEAVTPRRSFIRGRAPRSAAGVSAASAVHRATVEGEDAKRRRTQPFPAAAREQTAGPAA